LTPFPPKARPCKQCGTLFTPARPMQSVCSPKCAAGKVKKDKADERSQIKSRKEAIKTIPQLIKEAQVEFNKYIRARDKGKLCICCGIPLPDEGFGGGFDAGHYRSTGSASHLRFHEDNVHGQRKQCNRYGAGRAVDYRIGLIQRIGVDRVHELETMNTPHKWTKEELVRIKEIYRQKRKELSK
jgi:hypothetical protein